MIPFPATTQIWIVAGVTDMRRGFTGLSAMVQTALDKNPIGGDVYLSRAQRRSGEASLARWGRSLSFREAFGPRALRMAAGRERNGVSDQGAALDVV